MRASLGPNAVTQSLQDLQSLVIQIRAASAARWLTGVISLGGSLIYFLNFSKNTQVSAILNVESWRLIDSRNVKVTHKNKNVIFRFWVKLTFDLEVRYV